MYLCQQTLTEASSNSAPISWIFHTYSIRWRAGRPSLSFDSVIVCVAPFRYQSIPVSHPLSWKMHVLVRLLLLWSINLTLGLTKPLAPGDNKLFGRQTPSVLPPPSKDPWHLPQAGWENQKPGDILKLRRSSYPIQAIKNCIDSFQIQYRSSNTHGNASWAVTTVFIPTKHANCSSDRESCAHGLVSYQFPYNTAWNDASPSYFIQFGDLFGELEALLAQGWFVSVPDYEGPTASYCSGPQAGYATLDSIKAVLKVGGDFGLRMDKVRYTIWGYSGGALSAAFASEMAETYAPDLKFAGIVYGGPSPNISTAGELLSGKEGAGLLVACLAGITDQFPEARKFLVDHIKKEGRYNDALFFNVTKIGGIDTLRNYLYQDVWSYFVNGKTDYGHPTIQAVMNQDGLMGYRGTPKMPIFIYKAEKDEFSPTSQMDAVYDKYCDAGANILYHRNRVTNHTAEGFVGRPRVFQYLHTILDGEKRIEVPERGCQTVNVSIPLTDWKMPITDDQMGEPATYPKPII
jgi:hypothetical protein